MALWSFHTATIGDFCLFVTVSVSSVWLIVGTIDRYHSVALSLSPLAIPSDKEHVVRVLSKQEL